MDERIVNLPSRDPPRPDREEDFSLNDLREMAVLLLDYRWLIVGVTLVAVIATTVWTIQQPKLYQATCSIEYDPNPPRPLGEKVEDVADSLRSYWMAKEFFRTQNTVLGSRAVAERAATELGLHKDPDFFNVDQSERKHWKGATVQQAARRVQSITSITQPDNDTHIVYVSVTDRNPRRAMLIANAVVDAYVKKTIEDRLGTTVEALGWLREQMDTVKTKLDTSELALHNFKQKHNLLSVSLEDRQNQVSVSTDYLNKALLETRAERIRLSAHAAELEKLELDDPYKIHASVFIKNQVINDLRTQYRKVQAEKNALSTRYAENHPSIVEIEAQLESLREEMRTEIRSIINSTNADLKSVQKTESGLNSALNDANQDGLKLNLHEIEYNRLLRERNNQDKLYRHLLERSAETNLTKLLRMTFVRIVDRALVPGYAVAPRVKLNIGMGALAGLFIGILLAFVINRLDRTISRIKDLEHLGVTVLGSLPKIFDNNNDSVVIPIKALRAGTRDRNSVYPELIMNDQPMSVFAECCRTIRTNLSFMSPDRPLRSIVVTSADAAEGKTFVSTNLAVAFTKRNKKTLIVDTDFRKPRLHRAFNISNEKGIATVLSGELSLKDAIHSTLIPNLFVLPCGAIPPNPAELLHSDKFRHLIQDLLKEYDHVILDSPPLGAVTDGAIIAHNVDGALVVARSRKTTRDAFRSAIAQLYDVGTNSIVSVLNDVDLSKRWYRYTNSYRYYRRGYIEHELESTGSDS